MGMLGTSAAVLAYYYFNGLFNVANKRVLNELQFPWIISWVQLATGIIVVILPLWGLGLRRAPRVDSSTLCRFAPMAVMHAVGHSLQVAGIGAGSVYLGTVIKATEPIVGTLLALAVTGKVAPWYVNLTFLPIVGGVAYAAAKPGASIDLSDLFSFSAVAALGSTVCFAVAKLLAKRMMTTQMKEECGLDAVNTYSVLNCCSAALLLLPSFAFEGPQAWTALRSSDDGGRHMVSRLLLCGLYYFGYNEFGFRVLDALGPVSAAVAAAAKRVVVLFFAVYFLGESTSTRKLVGAAVAISGVSAYSFAKIYADRLAAAKTKRT